MKHITIYREAGRYAGWPANYGIWSWGDEIVVGFTLGYHRADAGFHTRDREKPFVGMQARSKDGGNTWVLRETPCQKPGDRGLSADEHMRPELGVGGALKAQDALMESAGGIDFSHPDFALMCARSGLAAGAKSWFYISYDRCESWDGPFRLPMFGQTGIAARTDYLVSSATECTLFLTAAKSNGEEGRAFCARTNDAGKTFRFLSWITPEPDGFTIMPASVRLSDTRMLAVVRCREGRRDFEEAKAWIDLYSSDDNGTSWEYMNRPVPDTGMGGNPPTLTKLLDGRLCMTYGYRGMPFGIRARISEDDGKNWGDAIILRDDGGNHDLGYPRTVQRPDGTIVTVYYFNDHPQSERHIAATLWNPQDV